MTDQRQVDLDYVVPRYQGFTAVSCVPVAVVRSPRGFSVITTQNAECRNLTDAGFRPSRPWSATSPGLRTRRSRLQLKRTSRGTDCVVHRPARNG